MTQCIQDVDPTDNQRLPNYVRQQQQKMAYQSCHFAVIGVDTFCFCVCPLVYVQ